MALVIKDRVKETTSTTGTGTLTLAGAVAGFDSFAEIGNSNTTYYSCTDGTDFEVGIGTYTASGTTLSRDTILESSGVTASANVNGAVSASTSVAVDGNSGTIAVGMRVRGTGISGVVTVATVTSQSAIALDTAVTLADNTALTFGDGKISWGSATRTSSQEAGPGVQAALLDEVPELREVQRLEAVLAQLLLRLRPGAVGRGASTPPDQRSGTRFEGSIAKDSI